jgi:hypothetical protein
MNAPITIPLTPAEYVARRQALAANGVQLPAGDSGTLFHDGVAVGCAYNGTDTLTITVTHKPWEVSESFVENKIREWFADAPKEG